MIKKSFKTVLLSKVSTHLARFGRVSRLSAICASLLVTSLLVTLLLASQVALAGFQFYGAPMGEAKWKSSGSRLGCTLSQDIPGYGKAVFKHRATELMDFRIQSLITPRTDGQALLFVQAPVWKRFAYRKLLGRIPLSAQKDIIVVPTDWAYRMAFELREGMETVWSHSDWADGQDLVTVKISPVSFKSAWVDFLTCRQGLVDYGYPKVRYAEFYFTPNSIRLSPKERAHLDKLAEYISFGPDYKHISIKAFSDSRGVRRLNLAVSKKRANMVKNYLVKRGVSSKRFVISAKGEAKPKYNNRTKMGRAKNRRVEVRLVR